MRKESWRWINCKKKNIEVDRTILIVPLVKVELKIIIRLSKKKVNLRLT